MVNELLIQMQSFDQPPLRDRMRARMIGWVNGYLPDDRQLTAVQARVPQHPADRGHEPRRTRSTPRWCGPAGSTGVCTSTCPRSRAAWS